MSARSFDSPHPWRTLMVAVVLAAAAFAAPATAMADRGHRGHGHGHGHGGGSHWQGGHGGPRLSIHLGAPFYGPQYYVPPRVHYAPPPVYYAPPQVYYAPPPVYYAPRVIYSAPLSFAPPVAYVPPVVYSSRGHAPPVYVERNDLGAVAPAPAPSADKAFWYFCTDSNTYYPYVTQCATPWERVLPTPPSAGR